MTHAVIEKRNFGLTRACIVCLLLLVCGIRPASADQFSEFDFNPETYFQFINNGASSTFGVYDSDNNTYTVPVVFRFDVMNDYDTARGTAVQTNIAATLTFSSIVDGQATVTDFGGGLVLIEQRLKDINMTFTAVNPEGGKVNLLTVSSSTGTLSGYEGYTTATLASSDNKAAPFDDTVHFSSDFINLNNTTLDTINLIPNSVALPFEVDANGYVSSFVASGNGNFAVEFPEPGTLPLLVVGFAGIVARRVYRKR